MTALKLGIEGLNIADISRIKILLRLLTGTHNFLWVFASEGPYDAVLTDQEHPTAIANAVRIEVLPEGSMGGPSVLVKPIDATQLEEVLQALQNQLQPTVFG